MREPTKFTASLAGSFLIAHPALAESNFRKTVLILPDHSLKDGSFGLILNRPTGRILCELIEGERLGPLSRTPVLQGGPVQRDQLLLAAFHWHPQTSLLECRHHLSIEEAAALATERNHTVRAFIGYSGWSPGQIEAELAARSWLVRRADQDGVLEIERAPRVWRELTSTFGPWFQLAAEAPDDPSQN